MVQDDPARFMVFPRRALGLWPSQARRKMAGGTLGVLQLVGLMDKEHHIWLDLGHNGHWLGKGWVGAETWQGSWRSPSAEYSGEGPWRNSLFSKILLYAIDIFADVFARLPYIKGSFNMWCLLLHNSHLKMPKLGWNILWSNIVLVREKIVQMAS